MAGPVCIGSSTIPTVRNSSRKARGGTHTAVPVPTITASIGTPPPAAASERAKVRASRDTSVTPSAEVSA